MKLLNLINKPALLRDDAFASLESVFNNLWNNAFEDHAFIHNISKEMYPRIDILDKDHCIEVHAEAPHFSKQDIKVKYEDGVLTINGTKDAKAATPDVKFIRREIKRSNFSRSFAIDPTIYDVSNIKAEFKDGILVTTINKVQQQQPKPLFIDVK
jgi:HSP20 family protein